ncbi:MAG TPA: extracellular solute-binding protein [Rhodocyclaceae bacterium]|nr:extracellular solute-binding protein [Rhodocyclaceae bacterium]
MPMITHAVTDLEFVHQLGADKGAQLAKLVERFNSKNPSIKITLSDRSWNDGKLPDLMLLDNDDEDLLIASHRYKPLWQVMKEAGEPLQTLAPPKMMAPTSLDEARRLVALPVGLSSPVMFYNKSVFEQAGINSSKPPKTWQDLQDVLGKLVQTGSACPFTTTQPEWIFIENVSTWNNQAYTSVSKPEQLSINGLMQVKHLAMMSSWYKSNYLKLFGRGDEAQQKFVDGNCVVMTAPSAAYPTLVRQAKFDVGVASFPYHGDAYGAPQNTLADGPNLWVAAGEDTAAYKAIAKFVHFWLTPESQLEWQVDAGYLPLNEAGLIAVNHSQLLNGQLLAQQIAIDELTHKPVTATSGATAYMRRPGVRHIIDEEIETVWANKKPAKQALDDAVARVRGGQNGCCRETVSAN